MKLRKILFGTSIAILCIGVTAYGVTRSPFGKNMIRNSVAHFTANTDYAVTIGPIHGDPFSDFTIEHIAISDPYGAWLTIDNAHLIWHPLALLKGKRGIELLGADKIDLTRLPKPEEKQEEKTASSPPDFKKLFSYVPKNIDLKDISLSEQAIGMGLHTKITASGDAANYLLTVETLEGSQTAFTSHIALQTDDFNIVRIAPGNITLGTTTIDISGQFDRAKETVDGKVVFNIPDLSQWQEIAKLPITGDIKGELTAIGPFNELNTTIAISSNSVTQEKLSVTNTSFNDQSTLDLSDLTKIGFNSAGKLALTLHQQDKPFQIVADYTAKGDAQKFGADLTSNIQSPYGNSAFHLTGNADLPEKIFSAVLDGTLDHEKNQITLKAVANSDKDKITVTDIDMSGAGVAIKGNGEWLIEPKLGNGNLSLNIPDLRTITQMVGVEASGKIKADAVFNTTDSTQQAEVNISTLDVTYDKKNIKLKDSAKFSLQDKTVHLSPAVFSFAGGTINARGDVTPETVDAVIEIKQLNTTKIIQDDTVKGIVNGRVVLSGVPQSPLINLNATLKGTSGTYPFDLSMNGDWKQDNLQIKTLVKSQRATAQAQANLQTKLSLMPFETDFSKDTPLKGNLIADLPLDILNPILWASRQNVSGKLDGKMNFAGTVGTPQMNGKFNLSNVGYIHSPSGVCLKNLNATILGTNTQLSLSNLESRDSDGGSIKADAKIALNEQKSLSAAIDLNHFKLFCGGLATGIIDGRITVNGNIQNRMMVDGKLTLGPLNVQLPGAQNNQDIPQIETIRVKDKVEKESAPGIIGLNIVLDAPNQIFIRGRGLDAEFGGKLNITGRARAPIIAGNFDARRGKFTLFDRVLKLSNAAVRFDGPIPPSPYLDINSETVVQSTTITITLNGPAAKPKFTLASQPTRPQDEVLALLLFGRQLQSISPFEALKLAQAARTLAGLDGGQPGVLDKARSTLGLDALDVGTDDNNNVTVSTGKYVTDKVYVGVQQGAEPQDKLIKTEIELTPSISANTTMDGEGNQGVGLGWRHDY